VIDVGYNAKITYVLHGVAKIGYSRQFLYPKMRLFLLLKFNPKFAK